MLSCFQAVFFVLLAGRTFADPLPEGPDEDQPLIDLLDEYVQNVHSRVVESTGYERLRVVVNASGEVLEFFNFMGYLLLNGTLGECVYGAMFPRNQCIIHMSLNRSRFGAGVADFLAKDRDDNLKDVENFPLLVLPDWESGRIAGSSSRLYLQLIFSDTWNFFDHMQSHIVEAHPMDEWGRAAWIMELPRKCSHFSADVTFPDNTIKAKALFELVGPGCENLECSATSWLFKDELQKECEAFADEHGFIGGTSNRCLHKFVVRYNNYSAKAYENFVGHVAKYLYWDTIAHGLCLSIDYYGKLVDAAEADRRRAWTIENLASTGDWLLEVDSVLAETPPPYWIVEAKRVMENAVGNETMSAASQRFESDDDEHGFNGGISNRCLHKFIIRYNNYSAEAYESFVGHVAKYVYWDTIEHGLCLSISWNSKLVNGTEAARRREWFMRNLVIIGDSLLEVDSVLAETPPPYWLVEAKRVIENVIGNETVPYPSSSDTVRLYKLIYNGFLAGVRSIAALQIKTYPVDILVYYPAYDSSEHCYRNFTNVILSGQFNGVNYVVSLRKGHVPSWITLEKATMERHFRDSDKSDQCDRIADVDLKMANKLTESNDLRAVVAVKCARKFVWYELGYQYFPAAYTEAPSVRVKQEPTYKINCGMIVLFP